MIARDAGLHPDTMQLSFKELIEVTWSEILEQAKHKGKELELFKTMHKRYPGSKKIAQIYEQIIQQQKPNSLDSIPETLPHTIDIQLVSEQKVQTDFKQDNQGQSRSSWPKETSPLLRKSEPQSQPGPSSTKSTQQLTANQPSQPCDQFLQLPPKDGTQQLLPPTPLIPTNEFQSHPEPSGDQSIQQLSLYGTRQPLDPPLQPRRENEVEKLSSPPPQTTEDLPAVLSIEGLQENKPSQSDSKLPSSRGTSKNLEVPKPNSQSLAETSQLPAQRETIDRLPIPWLAIIKTVISIILYSAAVLLLLFNTFLLSNILYPIIFLKKMLRQHPIILLLTAGLVVIIILGAIISDLITILSKKLRSQPSPVRSNCP